MLRGFVFAESSGLRALNRPLENPGYLATLPGSKNPDRITTASPADGQ